MEEAIPRASYGQVQSPGERQLGGFAPVREYKRSHFKDEGGLVQSQVHSAIYKADDGVQRAWTVLERGGLSRPCTCTVLRNQQTKQAPCL